MDTPEPARATPWQRLRRSAWAPLVAVIIALALVQGFAVKVYQIPSASMQPTLEVGDRLLVNRLPGAKGNIEQGDIVVFEEPEAWGPRPERSTLRQITGWVGDLVGFGPSNTRAVVKRVIAVGGQEVRCCDETGAVVVDGTSQPSPAEEFDFPFIPGEMDCESEPASARCFAPVTVPEGHYLMLGDNRSNSADSLQACRASGGDDSEECVLAVPEANLIGPVLARIWPLDKWGSPAGLSR